MAFVVAVASQKGGAGKSTVAANLATALLAEGVPVALLDTDPQGTLSRWHQERPEDAPALDFDAPAGWRVSQMVEKRRKAPGFLILDTPPHADADARRAIRSADLVLIPLQPSMPDVWAIDATLSVAADEKRPVALLLNRVPSQGKLRDEVRAHLRKRDLPVLSATLGNRTAFAAAFGRGLGAVEDAPRGLAAQEARALAAALRREAAP
ncbi:ParA family partition ATPase [Roseomonas gilardii]|uniref:ParA family partition ATPase n=1 Tax=Roseomonas gilardii TaxID=257708 RepID=UPI0011A5213F|nr:ParA family partition ATPase [Roseomonas gilardii]